MSGKVDNSSKIEVTFPHEFVPLSITFPNILNIYNYSNKIVYSVAGITEKKMDVYPVDVSTYEAPTVITSFVYTVLGHWK